MAVSESFSVNVLIAIAVVQAVLYGAIAWLSGAFAYGTNEQERPILQMLALFAASFVLYLVAIRAAVHFRVTWQLGWAIIVPALLYRCILVSTQPIQEIDVYRYLWDGAVSARGLNPYRFAPAQVSAGDSEDALNAELRLLAQLRVSSPAMAEVLRRIHYSDLSTIYPPVSQAVFAIAHWLTPHSASVENRVLTLKAVLSMFDMGTVVLVWLLLKAVGKHPGLTVAYAWCPLVIKEFSNTGHLDSIAVFFTTAALWCVVRQLAANNAGRSTAWLLAGSTFLALAIGAKLYPVILIPVLCAVIAANGNLIRAATFTIVATMLSACFLAPMLLMPPAVAVSPPSASRGDELPSPDLVGQPHIENSQLATPAAVSGLSAFLTRWEMNDFLFMIVVENLRLDKVRAQEPQVWFAIVPEAWRKDLISPLANILRIDFQTAAFLAARALATGTFLAIALTLVWNGYRSPDAIKLLEATFLTLAWFWLLLPTQNPWYWIWALPFLPFARGRAWYAVSGLVMLYYLRFWLQYHQPDGPVLGTDYTGPQFFDFVISWIEYTPWFAWLAISAYRRRLHAPVA